MAKLVLNALFRRRREGLRARVAEFPDIEVSANTIDSALARLRQVVWHRLRWTKVETGCSNEPISPVPQLLSDDLAAPIEIEVPTRK